MRVLANHAFPQNHNFQKPLCSGVNPIILLGANFVILPNLPSPLHPPSLHRHAHRLGYRAGNGGLMRFPEHQPEGKRS